MLSTEMHQHIVLVELDVGRENPACLLVKRLGSELRLKCMEDVTSMPTPTHLLLALTHLLFALTSLLPTLMYLLFALMHLLPTLTYLLLAPTYLLPTPIFLLRTPTLFLWSVRPTSVIPSGTYPVSFLSLT